MSQSRTSIALSALIVGFALGAGGVYFGRLQGPGQPDHEAHQGHDDHDGDEIERGPHGGRLLTGGNLDLEITIFESGVPPEFRSYAYCAGSAISPESVQLAIRLHRLGGRLEEITFEPVGGYLRGNRVVEEPHSFDVQVQATYQGQTYEWSYAQYEGRVMLPPGVVASARIEVLAAGPATIQRLLTLPGEIALNANNIAHVVPRLAGVVRAVKRNQGDRVTTGELMALLDSRELADGKSEYLSAIERRTLAQARFVREQELFARKISPEQEFLAARQVLAETDINVRAAMQKLHSLGLSMEEINRLSPDEHELLTQYEIRAPIDGTVIEKHITMGEAVKEDADIFVVADLSNVWAEIVVYANDLGRVRLGQSARIRCPALGLENEGTVSYLGPIVGQQTRTASAIVELPNPDGKWRPGLFVDVDLVEEEVTVPIAVHVEAIQSLRDWSVVFVKYGDVCEARPLELGRRDAQWVEVLSGLSAGEQYAAKNSFVIKADIGKATAAHEH